MWPDRVSNPGPPTYESGALPIVMVKKMRALIRLSIRVGHLCCCIVLLFYVHGKHLRSCRDGQLT